MANNLNMAIIHAIIGLLERGWSYRRIARELGVHRETVARCDLIRQGVGLKPAISTAGSSVEDAAFRPVVSRRSCRRSQCEPFERDIKAKLEQGLSAVRIWQDLVAESQLRRFYASVKRYVRRLGAVTPLPFRRMECAPGHEEQVDFGSGAWVLDGGKKRRPHVFRITLSNSRKGYSEAIWKQTTENFIRCPENAFSAFGGVPETLVPD